MRLRVAASLIATFALAAALPAAAAVVPFDGPVTVLNGVLDGSQPHQPLPADMDGDGDLDVLTYVTAGAQFVLWRENSVGDGSSWSGHLVASVLAKRLLAADVDADGDLDVVVANDSTDALVWYENLGGGTSFASAVAIASNVGQALAAADFDRDGDLDVGYTKNAAQSVVWARNDGGGASWTDELGVGNAGSEAWLELHAADLDRDGDPDLVGGQSGADERVAWFENNGSGGFAAVQNISTSVAFPRIALGDFDRDGDLDVAAASGTGGVARWFQNLTGDGSSWSSSVVANLSPAPSALDVGDLDLDGDLDLLAAQGITALVLENESGDGSSWQPSGSTETDTTDLAAADVDGDGDPDVVSAAGVVVEWIPNRTLHRSARFTQQSTLDADADIPYFVSSGDLDRDGDQDALIINVGPTGGIRWRENLDGNGSFGPANLIALANHARVVRVADMDRDGDPDLVTAATVATPQLAWHENTAGDASSWTARSVSSTFQRPYHADVGDLDGDGDLDVLASSSQTGATFVAWFENTAGNGSAFTQHAIFTADEFASDVRLSDVDGDGDLDAFYTELSNATIGWQENTAGNGTSWSDHVIETGLQTTGPNAVEPADVDADGDVDVVVASKTSNNSAWFENANGAGTSWTRHGLGAPARFEWLRVEDLDLDGDLDVAAASPPSDELYWFENLTGDGSAWWPQSLQAGLEAPHAIDAADFDGDGDPDLIATGFDDGDVIWLRNGGGQFALPTDSVAYQGMVNGRMREVLRIDLAHRGRAGDPTLRLETLELRLEDGSGAPLSQLQAGLLFQEIELRKTTPGGPLLASVGAPPSLPSGVLTLEVSGLDPNNEFAPGTSTPLYVRVMLTAAASSQVPNAFRFVHLTESSSSASDQDFVLPLTLEFEADTSTGTIQALPPAGDADADGLANALETDTHGTDPGDADTDGDQVGDGVEVSSLGTDPLDYDSDDDGLLEGDEVFLTTDPLDPDSDSDGFCDGLLSPGGCTAGDNCPAISNAPQTNGDAYVAGDVCQCGNVDGAGALSATDYLRAREHVVGRAPSGAFDEDFCDLNADTECDVADLAILQRALALPGAPLQNACNGYRGL